MEDDSCYCLCIPDRAPSRGDTRSDGTDIMAPMPLPDAEPQKPPQGQGGPNPLPTVGTHAVAPGNRTARSCLTWLAKLVETQESQSEYDWLYDTAPELVAYLRNSHLSRALLSPTYVCPCPQCVGL